MVLALALLFAAALVAQVHGGRGDKKDKPGKGDDNYPTGAPGGFDRPGSGGPGTGGPGGMPEGAPGGNPPGGNTPGGNPPGGNLPGGNAPGGNTPGGNGPNNGPNNNPINNFGTVCDGMSKKECKKAAGCIRVKRMGCQRTFSNSGDCDSFGRKKRACKRAGCKWDRPVEEYDYDYDYDYSKPKRKPKKKKKKARKICQYPGSAFAGRP